MHSQAEEPTVSPKQLKMASAEDVGTATGTDGSRTSIARLAEETLIQIFSHLSFKELIEVIPKVCSSWRRLSQDFGLWIDKEYRIGHASCYYTDTCKSGETDEEAIQIFKDVPNLHTVRMRRRVNIRVLHALSENCHRLSRLELHLKQQLSYAVLKKLVKNCPRIHTLSISNDMLKDKRFSKAFSKLQYLTVLQLEVNSLNKTPVLRPLGDGCPRLSEIDFGDVTVDMGDLKNFLNAKKNTLKYIHISWTMGKQGCVLPSLTVCADSLEGLTLTNMTEEGATEAFAALGRMKNLEELKFALIVARLPPGALALAFSAGLPKLRRLHMQSAAGLEDDAVSAIIQGCPALRVLSIKKADLLSDGAFFQIFHLKHLVTLQVSSCNGLGPKFIPRICRLPQLNELHLQGLDFRKLKPGVGSILQLRRLHTLGLDHSIVTGVPFQKFPENLISLRKLNIECCGGDLKATDGLMDLMPGLEINGNIEFEALPSPDSSPDMEDGSSISSSDSDGVVV